MTPTIKPMCGCVRLRPRWPTRSAAWERVRDRTSADQGTRARSGDAQVEQPLAIAPPALDGVRRSTGRRSRPSEPDRDEAEIERGDIELVVVDSRREKGRRHQANRGGRDERIRDAQKQGVQQQRTQRTSQGQPGDAENQARPGRKRRFPGVAGSSSSQPANGIRQPGEIKSRTNQAEALPSLRLSRSLSGF